MRSPLVLVVVVGLAACDPLAAPHAATSPTGTGTPSVTQAPPAASASPLAPPGKFAVIEYASGVGEPYYVQLVGFDGRPGPWVQALSRSEKLYYLPPTPCPTGGKCTSAETANYMIPETSISTTRVYFLDGETQVKSLAPDGVVAFVKTIGAPPNSQVAFSVSPDDRRIAVSVITLATTQLPDSLNVQMYVEDLAGGNRVDLYSSTTLAEWPIGWHAGSLVVAVGSKEIGTYDNPYAATGYHVVDPSSGRRLATLDCSRGLLVAAGTACADGWCNVSAAVCPSGTLGRQAWDGTKTAFDLPSGPAPRILVSFSRSLALSPDGNRLLAEVVSDPQTGATGTMMFENGKATVVVQNLAPQGWLDGDYIVVSQGQSIDFIDLRFGTADRPCCDRTVPGLAFPVLVGVLPANLG